MSPIAERLTPASRSQADWVEKISKNGRPDEKPSASINARRGSLRISRNRADLRGEVMPRTWRQKSEQAIQGFGFKSPSVGSKYLCAFSLASVVLISPPASQPRPNRGAGPSVI